MQFIRRYNWLLPMLSFSVVLLLMRIIHTESIHFLFIPWNLFLAVLPLVFSHWLQKTTDKLSAWCMFGLWLLFFPNAMYIVTDLFHLHESDDVPQWFDLLLLFSAALNGVLMGMVSLYNIEQFLRKKMTARYIHLALFSMFLLCGYGIYLGRYLRWNSWDLFTQPFGLLLTIAQNVRHPRHNIEIWLLTGLFATWLYLLYRYASKVVVAGVVKQV